MLSLRAQSNIQRVSIFTLLGQEVKILTPNTISVEVDMTELSKGAYFLNVSVNDVSETVKIIKK
jgi:hypothetical protein